MSNSSKAELHFKLLTPKEAIYDGKALAVTIPTANGYIQVLPGHMNLLSVLGEGDVSIKLGSSDGVKTYRVSSGVFQCVTDHLEILADAVKAF